MIIIKVDRRSCRFGTSFDLRTGWNLSCPRARNECWTRLLKEDPSLIIGSPKCGPFSSLTELIPDKTERMKARYREAYEHLKFCASVYRWQQRFGEKINVR